MVGNLNGGRKHFFKCPLTISHEKNLLSHDWSSLFNVDPYYKSILKGWLGSIFCNYYQLRTIIMEGSTMPSENDTNNNNKCVNTTRKLKSNKYTNDGGSNVELRGDTLGRMIRDSRTREGG